MINVYEKIRSVEFSKLPKPVQNAHLMPPVISVPIEQEEDYFQPSCSDKLQGKASECYMPKLGIKSWKESGSLALIYEGITLLPAVQILLQKPTKAQNISAQAWLKYKLPLTLHLSSYVDFSQVSEVRFIVSEKGIKRTSCCLRGLTMAVFQQVLPDINRFIREIKEHLPDYSHILDVAYLPNGKIRLIEVNPALTSQELKKLKAV